LSKPTFTNVKTYKETIRATEFLIQKISLDACVQHGNAVSVMVTIPSSQDWAEFAFLPIDWWIANDDLPI